MRCYPSHLDSQYSFTMEIHGTLAQQHWSSSLIRMAMACPGLERKNGFHLAWSFSWGWSESGPPNATVGGLWRDKELVSPTSCLEDLDFDLSDFPRFCVSGSSGILAMTSTFLTIWNCWAMAWLTYKFPSIITLILGKTRFSFRSTNSVSVWTSGGH